MNIKDVKKMLNQFAVGKDMAVHNRLAYATAYGYIECLSGEEVNNLVDAVENFKKEFEELRKAQNQSLVVEQTFESASRNWFTLQRSLDCSPLFDALSKFQEAIK